MSPAEKQGVVNAPDLEVLPGQVDGLLRLKELFGRAGKVEIEIGTGKGRFILREAEQRPETDFLGLEWSVKHLRIARDRAARRGLGNVRFYRADARHVISDLMSDASVYRVHVYCPDPWPKKRHHKRRLFTPETARHLERILEVGGYLNVSTDVRDYFVAMVDTIGRHTGLLPAADPLYPHESASLTHYEAKYRAAGSVIHRITWRRDRNGSAQSVTAPSGSTTTIWPSRTSTR